MIRRHHQHEKISMQSLTSVPDIKLPNSLWVFGWPESIFCDINSWCVPAPSQVSELVSWNTTPWLEHLAPISSPQEGVWVKDRVYNWSHLCDKTCIKSFLIERPPRTSSECTLTHVRRDAHPDRNRNTLPLGTPGLIFSAAASPLCLVSFVITFRISSTKHRQMLPWVLRVTENNQVCQSRLAVKLNRSCE